MDGIHVPCFLGKLNDRLTGIGLPQSPHWKRILFGYCRNDIGRKENPSFQKTHKDSCLVRCFHAQAFHAFFLPLTVAGKRAGSILLAPKSNAYSPNIAVVIAFSLERPQGFDKIQYSFHTLLSYSFFLFRSTIFNIG